MYQACGLLVIYYHLFQLMLQSSGKVARRKVRPASKLSNQKPGSSHHTNDAVSSAGVNHHTSSGINKSSDSSSMLPTEVEQIFEVNDLLIQPFTCVITYLT